MEDYNPKYFDDDGTEINPDLEEAIYEKNSENTPFLKL